MSLQVKAHPAKSQLAVHKDLEDITVRDVMQASFSSVYEDLNAFDALSDKKTAIAFCVTKTSEIYRGLTGENPPKEAAAALTNLVDTHYERVVDICKSQPLAVLGSLTGLWNRVADARVGDASLAYTEQTVRQIANSTAALDRAICETSAKTLDNVSTTASEANPVDQSSWLNSAALLAKSVAPDLILILLFGLLFL